MAKAHHKKRGASYTQDFLTAACGMILDRTPYKQIEQRLGISENALAHIASGNTLGSSLAMQTAIDTRTREKLWYAQYKR